ncbi:hypothetical protein GDI1359 [Gluconacetobacter diazotrophicus PA1 5]|uniref:Uncharacterized protein n=1 Tax=Gluconacetobacter diazotrophicus (strain ATCC 49037 / DSM 5601 / CCUG 37298 / CIP 103539 / LMG 7603 / PAl5) TaxID=272568 RepID=A9HF02_GLUDA|nr:hypothetical protein GDI1359 [Gluconacetobacter diazotrophicus PA1 5]
METAPQHAGPAVHPVIGFADEALGGRALRQRLLQPLLGRGGQVHRALARGAEQDGHVLDIRAAIGRGLGVIPGRDQHDIGNREAHDMQPVERGQDIHTVAQRLAGDLDVAGEPAFHDLGVGRDQLRQIVPVVMAAIVHGIDGRKRQGLRAAARDHHPRHHPVFRAHQHVALQFAMRAARGRQDRMPYARRQRQYAAGERDRTRQVGRDRGGRDLRAARRLGRALGRPLGRPAVGLLRGGRPRVGGGTVVGLGGGGIASQRPVDPVDDRMQRRNRPHQIGRGIQQGQHHEDRDTEDAAPPQRRAIPEAGGSGHSDGP